MRVALEIAVIRAGVHPVEVEVVANAVFHDDRGGHDEGILVVVEAARRRDRHAAHRHAGVAMMMAASNVTPRGQAGSARRENRNEGQFGVHTPPSVALFKPLATEIFAPVRA